VDELIFRSFKGLLTPDEEQTLTAWRASSPEHEARYRELGALAELTSKADAATRVRPSPSVEQLVRSVSPAPPAIASRPRKLSHKLALAAAIGLAAGALLVAGILSRSGESWSGFVPEQIVTSATETTTVTFPDGTVVRLAPNSRLRVTPGTSRDVTLEGRAYFDVAKVNRRFRVRTLAGDAVVLGTRFEVRATDRSAQVLVLEGRVALGGGGERVEVGAGEVSRLVRGTASRPEKVPDANQLVNWIGRFLVFRATPLPEALREIQRQYNTTIELRDSALVGTTITGWYADKSFEEVMQIVCSVVDRECAISRNHATIGEAHAR
jgi:transmembrane sensor